ncbi:hypothetical protein [Paenibacillus apiarius]|uniref:Group-specific protein n=1 Tax=Paenibacillus apiarius TaxID=46240 RepID=A0ABT4DQP4_9BACL|nr:hypothetical protein [Paenibacillus apiarius]MBN3526939.1 hypothetical protein [Paenibacillus apiarius]MCY9516321.1 hypothetical protein [Paenibacillus apiarius]MCY9519581.1 hypothetical protein [Paenibacillus apiarius]MCY9554657.1 hypothetical protein [Paenibacillus apiarius]MCY9561516.1 hypothetical protein [Paenibacillus apiarius]
MFDPTIFDNLKVVFEGKLYDVEREADMIIVGREDIIDLAGYNRIFRMRMKPQAGSCIAELQISSGLPDFAGELRGIRIVDEEPGALLQLVFELPGEQAVHSHRIHERLTALWADSADIVHERSYLLAPCSVAANTTEPADNGTYRIQVKFRQKINESHIDDIDSLMDHVIRSIETLES